MTVLLAVLAGVLGLAVGSFLNVLIWRLPRNESLSHPASHCPHCDHPIRGYDNVPLLSWALLRAKCRDCGAPISVRYPLIELATGLLFAGVTVWAVLVGPATALTGSASALEVIAAVLALLAYLYLGAISVALAAIDIELHRLPDRIVLPSIVVVAALLSASSLLSGDAWPILWGAVGSVGLFLLYFVMAVAYPGGMGFGDVKLAALLGFALAWLGWAELAVGAFGAFVFGGVFSLILLIARRAGRRSKIPFGPWMLAGAFAGIVVGSAVFSGYLRLFGLA